MNAQAEVPNRGLLSAALALGTFMQVLDTTIANVSIPTIAGDLGVSADQGTWVITSFAVANGISVPLTGWLMQRYGVVKVFVLSVLLFTLASFLCGVAWSLSSLICFRVLQGAVSGPMIPGSQALLLSLFPPEKKGVGLGIWSMTTLVGPVCGPILGGYISDNFSWPWIFLMNVPIGILCALVCWQGLKHRETPTRKLPIDGIGLGLLIAWVGSLQVMLDKGKDADWFASPFIVGLAVVAVVGFIAFVIWELGEKHPIIDLSLFKNRNFTNGTIALCVGYALFFATVVLQPLWMQSWVGYNATWAGLVAAPSGVVAVILTPFIARNMGKFDARIFATLAYVIFAVSYFMRTYYTNDADPGTYIYPMMVQGAAMSMFFVSLLTILLYGVPDEKVPAASGLSNFARIISGGFATSIVTTLWDRRAALHTSHLADASYNGAPVVDQAVANLTSHGLDKAQAMGALAHQQAAQAYLLSFQDIFWGCCLLSVAAVVLVWLSKRPHGHAPAVAAD
ncbi:DHA2 family efflux MFS transporter permease subunit [Gallaecimonas mangrovi]|uniref:DHA2 family efflux MFS transporter permease subunit n=1 Tax=Gallaecimonas mangrovi TaxID=2291597 RepID=UPI001D0236C9|nr:DHA2 family efflux MFS transporter permease subunit [Gallaecimonas mangrovi]